MSAEHVRPAAVVSQGRQRLDRLVFALPRAEIALQAPEGGDYGGWHAKFFLLASEDCLVLFDLGGAGLETIGGHHLAGEFQKRLGEESLSAVDVDDALIEHQVRRCGRDRSLRYLLGSGLTFELGQPALKTSGVTAILLTKSLVAARHQHRQYCQNQCRPSHRP